MSPVFKRPTPRSCRRLSVDVDRSNQTHVVVFTDADSFEPEEQIQKAAVVDKWEGEDEEEDVKVS